MPFDKKFYDDSEQSQKSPKKETKLDKKQDAKYEAYVRKIKEQTGENFEELADQRLSP